MIATQCEAASFDERLSATISRLTESIEIAEPLERVRDAIREAQRLSGGGATQESAAA